MHEHHGDETTVTGASCGCGHGKRNRFFRGKHMNADSFSLEQRYLIGRRRLVNRAVLGWGVVYGFPVSGPRKGDVAAPGAVGRGLGFDAEGREVHLTATTAIERANTFLATLGGPRPADQIPGGRYLLSIHYAERRVEDARVTDDCGCGEPEKQFVCETAVFSLKPLGDRPCPCAEKECRSCRCEKGTGEATKAPEETTKAATKAATKETAGCCADGPRGCGCLCQWTGDGPEECETDLCEWNGLWISPSGGIPLACVAVAGDTKPSACDPIELTVEDDCGPRRIVKSNDVLYDLVRGCDLTHIEWISWDEWHRAKKPVPWKDFVAKFEAGAHTKDADPVRTNFVVRFSGPVLQETLQADAVVMTAIAVDQQTGWMEPRRIPIDHLDLAPDTGNLGAYTKLPDGTTNQFRVYVKSDWHWDEVEKSRRSALTGEPFIVEIEVRGDFIYDCRNTRIDGNARAEAGRATPTGNGTPGDTFVSTFQVLPKDEGVA